MVWACHKKIGYNFKLLSFNGTAYLLEEESEETKTDMEGQNTGWDEEKG